MKPDISENTVRRKRQRSTSGASESAGSSPKRAASEGPSLTSESGLRSSASVEPQPFSNLSIIEDHDTDMTTLDGVLLPRWREWSATQKLDDFSRYSNALLEFGQPWYMIAAGWLKDWKMACRGEVDKQGPRDQATLGPVNNTPLVDMKGELKPGLLDQSDYELIPKPMWELFVEWYCDIHVFLVVFLTSLYPKGTGQ